VLDVPIVFFFEGLVGPTTDTGAIEGDIPTYKEAGNLVRAYYVIPDVRPAQALI
jgi:hypothetical protein